MFRRVAAAGLLIVAAVPAAVPPAAVHARGTIEPAQVADATPSVAGRIQAITPDGEYGRRVKAGTVLAQLDPAPYRVKAEQARADLRRAEAGLRVAMAKATLAERELDRVKKREGDKVADAGDVEVAKAALDVAKAAVEVKAAAVGQCRAGARRADQDVAACAVRAPIDGVIIDRRCTVGQAVAGGGAAPSLFLIAGDLKKLQVWATVTEADVGRVAKGRPARVTVDAFPGATFQGRVSNVRLNATMVKDRVTFTVVIDVDNSDGKLLPYLTADMTIAAGDEP
jgi:HlyD family secretion protein